MSDAPNDLVIYGSPISPFVRKVASVCLEKGAGFDVEPVNVFDPPQWFKDISPMKRIPVLRDRAVAAEGTDGTIADSSAICGYIEAKHPNPALYPAEPFARGRALFFEEYADTMLAPAGGLGIFRPIFFSITKGEAPDLETARETWATKLPPVFDYLESALGDNEFFSGNALSIADISIACCLMQVSLVAETPLDKWSRFAAHFERMQARPSIAGPFAQAGKAVRKALPEPFDLT